MLSAVIILILTGYSILFHNINWLYYKWYHLSGNQIYNCYLVLLLYHQYYHEMVILFVSIRSNFSFTLVCLIIIPVCFFTLDKSAGVLLLFWECCNHNFTSNYWNSNILFAMYYTHQELQIDHHFIVLWQLFQCLEGGTLIRFWKFGRVVLLYFLGTIIRHTRVHYLHSLHFHEPLY